MYNKKFLKASKGKLKKIKGYCVFKKSKELKI